MTWSGEIPPLLFWQEVLVITDHKPLISMFKIDVATLL